MPRLKVFCATSGFHDSIVAAPSRPAALKAWGAKTDLFSMGVAREVTDPKIKRKALDRPGEVIRLDRSGAEDAPSPRRKKVKARAKPPSKAKLVAAEERLTRLQREQAEQRALIEHELRALEKKLEQVDRRHSKARKTAEEALQEERSRYRAALDDWSG